MKVAVIGGGAAGFFAAISVKQHHPDATVVLFEQSSKYLSKVKISGGGRCNVTNACTDLDELAQAYPRGSRQLKRAFRTFSTSDTVQWFKERKVKLKTEPDDRIFPVSDDSQTVIDCLLGEIQQLKVSLKLSKGVRKISVKEAGFELGFHDHSNDQFDKLIIATGGSPTLKGFQWLADLGHQIESPVPSLFTFNMPKEKITKLMGVVVKEAQVSIVGTKWKMLGPVLITHWGMSGPAVLKLSAFAARWLHEQAYQFKVQLNWLGQNNHELALASLQQLASLHPNKLLLNHRPEVIPKRLWAYILNKAGIEESRKWNEMGKKGMNKLCNLLVQDTYEVSGKTTFKEEFVTCGGISLKEIEFNTMESKMVPNLFFAGEVLDIDGITGGYNFQAAWTTAFIAGKLGKGS